MRVQYLLLVAAVLMATLVIGEEASDESQAISKIELLGGKVTRDDKLPGRPVTGIDFVEVQR